MNISKSQVDDLNAVITVAVTEEDYSSKVTETLKNYKRNANIPGFRKGNIPMGLIRKQYGKAVIIDEVNKLIQSSLFEYLQEQDVHYLGNPLPKSEQNIDWDSKDFTFDFDLGLAPEFEVDFGQDLPDYLKVKLSEKDVEDQIERIRTQYGNRLEKQQVSSQEDVLIGAFTADSFEDEEKRGYFRLSDVKEESKELFNEVKVDQQIELVLEDVFAQGAISRHIFGLTDQQVDEVKSQKVTFTVETINFTELAALDEALFKKLYPELGITTQEAFKEQLIKDGEKEFSNQSDQKFLDDVSKAALDNTTFDLPKEFLTRWIQVSGEKELTEQEAQEEFTKNEKGIRYQLIEGKLAKKYDIKVEFEDLKAYIRELVVAQFGRANTPVDDSQLDDIVANVLKNQDEVKQLSEQLVSKKLVSSLKENLTYNQKELSSEEFIKELYPQEA